MKTGCIFSSVLIFVVGGLIGAGIGYHYSKCKTHETSIKLNSSSKSGPGITITNTGDGKQ